MVSAGPPAKSRDATAAASSASAPGSLGLESSGSGALGAGALDGVSASEPGAHPAPRTAETGASGPLPRPEAPASGPGDGEDEPRLPRISEGRAEAHQGPGRSEADPGPPASSIEEVIDALSKIQLSNAQLTNRASGNGAAGGSSSGGGSRAPLVANTGQGGSDPGSVVSSGRGRRLLATGAGPCDSRRCASLQFSRQQKVSSGAGSGGGGGSSSSGDPHGRRGRRRNSDVPGAAASARALQLALLQQQALYGGMPPPLLGRVVMPSHGVLGNPSPLNIMTPGMPMVPPAAYPSPLEHAMMLQGPYGMGAHPGMGMGGAQGPQSAYLPAQLLQQQMLDAAAMGAQQMQHAMGMGGGGGPLGLPPGAQQAPAPYLAHSQVRPCRSPNLTPPTLTADRSRPHPNCSVWLRPLSTRWGREAA